MKACAATLTHIRPAAALTTLGILALMTASAPADARSCGKFNRPPAYWGVPMFGPSAQGTHKVAPYGPKSGIGAKAGHSVIAVAKRAGDFGILLTAVEAAGLTGLLEGDGPYTLFAPTDAAFEDLPEGTLQELLADKDKLRNLLKRHVVPGRTSAVEILQSRELKTASGQALATGELSVIRADIPASNGVVHFVDKVMLPAG